MANAPGQIELTQEVPIATPGDQTPNADTGTLILFPEGGQWYAKSASGVVTLVGNTAAQFGAKGDLFAGTGVGTGDKLAVGSAGQVLTVGGADPSGLEWSNQGNPALQYNDLLGWTFDPVGINGRNNYAGAAQVMLSRIPLPAAITVTNVITYLTTLGLTLTHSYLALFKSDGTVIGQSADQSTAWGALGATGVCTLPLAGGPHVCTPLAANDFLWAAWYVGTAVTAPSFPVAANNYSGILIGETAARIRSGNIVQADTATLGSIVPGNINSSGTLYWMAIS